MFCAIYFGLATPICKEHIRDFDTKFVITVEEFPHPARFWSDFIIVEKDTVDVECNNHILLAALTFPLEISSACEARMSCRAQGASGDSEDLEAWADPEMGSEVPRGSDTIF